MPGGVGYNMDPTEADRIHCVCFVVSALAVSLMDEAILDKFKAIRTEANGRSKTMRDLILLYYSQTFFLL